MFVSTTNDVPGYEVTQLIGIVRGNTVRARHVGKDIIAGLRNIVGGEITEYTKLLAEAREQAMDRMVTHAKLQGADAIIGARLTTSTVSQSAAEILAYGTAVKLKKREQS